MKSIDPFVYQEMLKKFLETVWDVELEEDQKKRYQRGSESIWKITEKGKSGSNFFEELFCKDFKPARDHFTRKIHQYGDKNIPIKPLFLKIILRFIGINPPEHIKARDLNTVEKESDLLYQIFEKRVLDDVNREDRSSERENFISNTEIKSHFEQLEWLPTSAQTVKISKPIRIQAGTLKPPGEYYEKAKGEIIELIHQYFSLLTNQSYAKALQLWEPKQIHLRFKGNAYSLKTLNWNPFRIVSEVSFLLISFQHMKDEDGVLPITMATVIIYLEVLGRHYSTKTLVDLHSVHLTNSNEIKEMLDTISTYRVPFIPRTLSELFSPHLDRHLDLSDRALAAQVFDITESTKYQIKKIKLSSEGDGWMIEDESTTDIGLWFKLWSGLK